jgi:hypothetical protein
MTTDSLPSEMQDKIVEACHKLNVRGVGELLTLGTVNKAFRRSVDQLLCKIMKRETQLDASSFRLEENANHQAGHWIALGCVSFVRDAKMRAEPHSKVHVRSFLYTVAQKMCDFPSRDHLHGRIAHALARSSQDWYSDDQAKRVAARDAFVRIATSRLAPGGQSLLPELSEEEIRKTLNLAFFRKRR